MACLQKASVQLQTAVISLEKKLLPELRGIGGGGGSDLDIFSFEATVTALLKNNSVGQFGAFKLVFATSKVVNGTC